MENKTIPLEVTNSLQVIADKYQYSADQMHQHKVQVVDELHQAEKGYITTFLFPNGLDDNERWLHALVRMEVRRLHQICNSRKKG
jgi:aspartyl aminopeptidase